MGKTGPACAWRPAKFMGSGTKFIAECVHADGFAPLNLLSGGGISDADGEVQNDQTISDASANSDVLLFGADAPF